MSDDHDFELQRAVINAHDAYTIAVHAAIDNVDLHIKVRDMIDYAHGVVFKPLEWPNPADVAVAMFLRSLQRDGYEIRKSSS
jgi:hypothetical protein